MTTTLKADVHVSAVMPWPCEFDEFVSTQHRAMDALVELMEEEFWQSAWAALYA